MLDKAARPVVIVSDDAINAAERLFVHVVTMTHTEPPESVTRFCVDVSTLKNPGNLDGFIVCDSLTALSRQRFIGLRREHLFFGDDLAKINAALKQVLDIP